ncbi:Methylaspartate mutase, E subunit [Chondromyces apiculatus DSM 436]|uniref:Methylaspartate mutase, E subunit n=2 Tax=Chondromyces apiculatus TaxID=51 RepID=A0A017SWU6_9BACT|nr:Methylaspartate mutase, E subunit [Chondromyces apiculatus DSM 436]
MLLGGIGGDSHSVGLAILRQALQTAGYRVHYLGIQNRLEAFFRAAPFCSAVLISNMDGHASHYLREFPELIAQHRARREHAPLWYLGGNIHVHGSASQVREILSMGFARVFPSFVDVETVLQLLENDLSGRAPASLHLVGAEIFPQPAHHPGQVVTDARVALTCFHEERLGVLEQWKTGHEAKDLVDNARFLREQPSFSRAQALVSTGERPLLLQPRAGIALLEGQLEMFRRFKRQGLRVLSYQVDSLTRQGDYAGAAEGLRASQNAGASTLNGLPVVNYGVGPLRRVISTIGVPLQTRHSARDPRLLAEISYASGVTSFEGGAIGYNIPYYRDYPLEDAIHAWQHVDRLTGLYHEEFGIVLDRELFGPLTATLIPPCLALVATLVEAVLAIQQGVKCVSLGYAEQGNRAQDIAAMRTLRQMAHEMAHHLGYRDVQINTVFHQYMAAFPGSHARAEALIEHSATTAALAGATRIITKTPVEALRIPSVEDNLRGIALATRGVAAAAGVSPDEPRIAREVSMLRAEVDDLLDSLLRCGGGSFTRGVVEAFRCGYLDVPFSPSVHNRGLVATARDVDGAVRFLNAGNLQLRREVREFHRDRMQDRMHAEGLSFEKQGYLLVERDVMRIPRNQFDHWPLA